MLAIVVIAIVLIGFAWATRHVLEKIRNIRTKPTRYGHKNDASDLLVSKSENPSPRNARCTLRTRLPALREARKRLRLF